MPGTTLASWAHLSPNGQRIAVRVDEPGTSNIWVYDTRTGTRTQLTSGPQAKTLPIWTPDGAFVTFQQDDDIYWQPADGSGPAEMLWGSQHPLIPYDWSDTGFLAFEEDHPETGSDIWVFSLEDRTAEPLLNTDADEGWPMFSPDGRWVSYWNYIQTLTDR